MRIFGTDTGADASGFPARRSRAHGAGPRKVCLAAALAAALAVALPAAALAGAFPAELNLSTLDGKNGFAIAGTFEGDGDGSSVSSAGDVNGDGIDDIIVGGTSAHVIFGTAQGFPANLPLSALDGTNGFALKGSWHYGVSSVSGAGDVNGDGIGDIIVGAGGIDPIDFTDVRRSHVVFGTNQGFPAVFDLSTLDGTNGFTVNAFSSSVSGAGDVNGDGFADIVIGDYLYGQDFPYPDFDTLGRAYVVFGSARGFPPLVDTAALNGTNGFAFEGIPDTIGSVGYSVSGAGDINGDGFDDIIVGSLQSAFAVDEFYVLFGTARGSPAVIHPADLNGANGLAIFTGDYELLNWASDAGDVNGDGIDDIIVGQPYFRESWDGLAVGRSYVLFGARQPFPVRLDLSALDGTNGFALDGVSELDFAGFPVSGAGDVNGDGIGDVIVAAQGVDVGGLVDAGRSYVVFGSDKGFPAEMPLSALDGTNGFALSGVDADDQAGYSVSGAGDVNGDGVDDIIVGAPHIMDILRDPGIGHAYVVFGRRVPGLTVSGACPGTVTVEVTRATPGATLGLVSALVEGRYVVPSGTCAGAVLDLENPALYTTLTADADGAADASANVPAPACGRVLQVIDAATCTPSNVAAVP